MLLSRFDGQSILTARKYGNQRKRRFGKEGDELVTNSHQLKMPARTHMPGPGLTCGTLNAGGKRPAIPSLCSMPRKNLMQASQVRGSLSTPTPISARRMHAASAQSPMRDSYTNTIRIPIRLRTSE